MTMMTIGLMALEGDVRTETSTITNDWEISRLHPNVGVPQFKVKLKRCEAFAFIGASLKKAKLTRIALSLGKHVLNDFPPAATWNEVERLKEISISNHVYFYTPNLLQFRTGMNALREMVDRKTSQLLSLTISCGFGGRADKTYSLMKFAQIIDLAEWLVGSKCANVSQEKSERNSAANARILLISHENDVKTLLNLCFGPRLRDSLWIDAIFTDSIIHLDPNSQNLRFAVSRGVSSEVDWSAPPLSRAMNEFKMIIGGSSEMTNFSTQRRLLELTRQLL